MIKKTPNFVDFEKIILFIFYNITIIGLVTGCQGRPMVSPTPTEGAEKTQISVTQIASQEIRPVPTSSANPTTELFMKETVVDQPIPDHLPDLLFTYGYKISCGPAERKIYLSNWPYQKVIELSNNPSLDFKFPTYSADGEWIAYVESDTNIIREGTEDQPGSGQIAIMRADGSQKQVASAVFDESYFQGINGMCDITRWLASKIFWSSDGKYILAGHVDWADRNPVTTYFLVNIETKLTTMIEGDFAEVSWVPGQDKLFLVQKDLIIQVVQVDHEQFRSIMTIQAPSGVPLDASFSFLSLPETYDTTSQKQADDFMYATIRKRDEKKLDLYDYDSFWKLNIKTGEWTVLYEARNISQEDTVDWEIAKDWVLSCTGKDIYLYDKATWAQSKMKIIASDGTEIGCRDFKALPGTANANLVSFEEYDEDGNSEGIWVTRLLPGISYAQPVVTFKSLNLESGYDPELDVFGYYGVLDYLWRP